MLHTSRSKKDRLREHPRVHHVPVDIILHNSLECLYDRENRKQPDRFIGPPRHLGRILMGNENWAG